MTTDRKLGSAVPGATTNAFEAATGQWDTPAGQLDLLGAKLSEFEPTKSMTPSETAKGDKAPGRLEWMAKMESHIPGLKDLSGKTSTLAVQMRNTEELGKDMVPYLDDQGRMTRGGLARFLADTANRILPDTAAKDSMFGPVKPNPELVKQASDMLAKWNVKDEDHSVATGLAKIAVLGSGLAKEIVASGINGPAAGERAEKNIIGKSMEEALSKPLPVSKPASAPKT
jgi:hypothetical protein